MYIDTQRLINILRHEPTTLTLDEITEILSYMVSAHLELSVLEPKDNYSDYEPDTRDEHDPTL
jgi:hypothetical protein